MKPRDLLPSRTLRVLLLALILMTFALLAAPRSAEAALAVRVTKSPVKVVSTRHIRKAPVAPRTPRVAVVARPAAPRVVVVEQAGHRRVVRCGEAAVRRVWVPGRWEITGPRMSRWIPGHWKRVARR